MVQERSYKLMVENGNNPQTTAQNAEMKSCCGTTLGASKPNHE
jgi:hypothetical protein